MDVNALLAQLRTEREMLEEAILALERLARGGGKRRGRPPKWLLDVQSEPESAEAPAKKKVRVLNEEARRKMSEAQRKRWAAKRGNEPADGG